MHRYQTNNRGIIILAEKDTGDKQRKWRRFPDFPIIVISVGIDWRARGRLYESPESGSRLPYQIRRPSFPWGQILRPEVMCQCCPLPRVLGLNISMFWVEAPMSKYKSPISPESWRSNPVGRLRCKKKIVTELSNLLLPVKIHLRERMI